MDRRRFLTAAGIGGAAIGLSGCKVLDSAGKGNSGLRSVFASAEGLTYRTQRLLGGDALAPEFTQADIRQGQKPNGTINPSDADYQALASAGFADWRLNVVGAVEKPLSLSLAEVQAMPARTQITRHDCVEGWSCIAKWTGVQLSRVLDAARPKREARFVVFHCMDT
ncbi:MAG: molybdopterin-dependent oxidoreductase, partial [Paracoccaceae bacterium]